MNEQRQLFRTAVRWDVTRFPYVGPMTPASLKAYLILLAAMLGLGYYWMWRAESTVPVTLVIPSDAVVTVNGETPEGDVPAAPGDGPIGIRQAEIRLEPGTYTLVIDSAEFDNPIHETIEIEQHRSYYHYGVKDGRLTLLGKR